VVGSERCTVDAAARLAAILHLVMPAHHDCELAMSIGGCMRHWPRAADAGTKGFPELLLTPSVGVRAVRALAMVTEIVHGAAYRFADPAPCSLAHHAPSGRRRLTRGASIVSRSSRARSIATRWRKIGSKASRSFRRYSCRRWRPSARRRSSAAISVGQRVFTPFGLPAPARRARCRYPAP
jgi:hypothetical protein